jgi:hypothetical protein
MEASLDALRQHGSPPDAPEPSGGPSRVLVIANSPHRLGDLLILAGYLARGRRWEFEFLCSPLLSKADGARIAAQGFPHRFLLGAKGRPSASPAAPAAAARRPSARDLLWRAIRGNAALRRLARFVRPALEATTAGQILQQVRLARTLRTNRELADAVLAETGYDIVIATGDRHLLMEVSVLKAARDRGIPILIPYLATSDPAADVRMRRDRPVHHRTASSSLYTRWVFWRHRGQIRNGTLFYRPFEMTALGRFGAMPTRTWMVGSGLSDVVCVDNRHTHGRYLAQGVPPGKLRILGDVSYDNIHAAYERRAELRAAMMDKYGCRPDRKVVIVSVPQLGEHDILPWDRHWEEVDFLLSRVAGLDQNLLVSLHPKMDLSKYAYLESKYGCRILQERLAGVLPIADLFVATFSSTVIWSVLCGIKSVVVDFYGLNYAIYDFLASVRVVRDKARLREDLDAWLEARVDFSGDWHHLSRNEVFDGRTLERYASLLAALKPRSPAR